MTNSQLANVVHVVIEGITCGSRWRERISLIRSEFALVFVEVGTISSVSKRTVDNFSYFKTEKGQFASNPGSVV